MREPVDAAKIHRFLRCLGEASQGAGRVYVTGGATALLTGWRESTVDIDLKLDPEPKGAFEAIARLKDELGVNVELASPDLFLPTVPGWRERSRFIARHGEVEFFHYDLISQALSKIARGYERDFADVRAMVERSLVEAPSIRKAFSQIEPELIRVPGLDATAFRARLERILEGLHA